MLQMDFKNMLDTFFTDEAEKIFHVNSRHVWSLKLSFRLRINRRINLHLINSLPNAWKCLWNVSKHLSYPSLKSIVQNQNKKR